LVGWLGLLDGWMAACLDGLAGRLGLLDFWLVALAVFLGLRTVWAGRLSLLAGWLCCPAG
jgi:hypothetical protein